MSSLPTRPPKGGANKQSLWKYQQAALQVVTLRIDIYQGLSHDPRWHPLPLNEVEVFEGKKSVEHWHTYGIVALADAYWMKDDDSWAVA